MDTIYENIRQRARQIAARFPSPDFYKTFFKANEFSRHFFEADPIIVKLQGFVAGKVKNNLGHGLGHAVKVSIDAGALMIIEGGLAGYSKDYTRRRLLLVQCAGLLHDLKRKHKNHAVKGAVFSRELLKGYTTFKPDEVEDISKAIENHEAFQRILKIQTPEGILISDCLYDADKFRWGPDNFTHTVWDIVAFSDLPLQKFVELYPNGMEALARIRNTFRTQTGKKYGPQFIDTGITIGKQINHVIKTEFAQHF
jgi:hypothetical protein